MKLKKKRERVLINKMMYFIHTIYVKLNFSANTGQKRDQKIVGPMVSELWALQPDITPIMRLPRENPSEMIDMGIGTLA